MLFSNRFSMFVGLCRLPSFQFFTELLLSFLSQIIKKFDSSSTEMEAVSGDIDVETLRFAISLCLSLTVVCYSAKSSTHFYLYFQSSKGQHYRRLLYGRGAEICRISESSSFHLPGIVFYLLSLTSIMKRLLDYGSSSGLATGYNMIATARYFSLAFRNFVKFKSSVLFHFGTCPLLRVKYYCAASESRMFCSLYYRCTTPNIARNC